MPSPACTVNGGATTPSGVDVTAGTLVTIALASTSGVQPNQWQLTCIGTDETNVPATIQASLSINLNTFTATFTIPSTLGQALIFQSVVNNGRDVNNVVQASYTTTFGVFVRTVNGQRVLATQETTESSATNGWTVDVNSVIRSAGAVVLQPLGTGADDWPGLATAMATWANKRPIALAAGTWNCKSVQNMPSGTVLIGNPGVRIVQTLSDPSNDPHVAAISAFPSTTGYSTTLSSNNVVGAKTVTVAAVPTDGTYIRILDASNPTSRAAVYRVVSHSGAGPYTATLDRPVMWQFHTADTVVGITPVTGVRILGGGMTMTGTGDRFIEFQSAIGCYVEDVNFDTTGGAPNGGGFWMSWDNGSIDCEARRIIANGNSTLLSATLVVETGERCRYVECMVTGSTNSLSAGIALLDCYDCALLECKAYGNYDGIQVSAGTSNLGCLDCRVEGCETSGNARHGVNVDKGSAGTSCVGIRASSNTNAGLNVGTTAVSTQIVDLKGTGNAEVLQVQNGAVGTRVTGLDSSGQASLGVNCAAPVDIEQWYSNGDNINGIAFFSTAGPVNVRGFNLAMTNTGQTAVWTQVPATFESGRISVGASSVGILVDVTTARIRNTTITQTASGSQAVNGNAGSTIRFGTHNDFDGCTTPLSLAGTCHSNRGTVTLNGTTGVDYNFRDLKSTDVVHLTRKTTSATPNVTAPTWTTTLNTKVTVSGTIAGTSDVYQIDIDG